MVLTVIFNGVASAHDFLCKVRVAQHAFADAKKSGAGCAAIEQLKHLRRDIRIRPIIDGDGDARRLAAALY